MRRPLSIRALLLGTTGALTLIIALLAAREVLLEWQQLAKVETLKRATYSGERMFDLLENLSNEREVAFSMLRAPDAKIVRDLRPRLMESRRKVDVDMQQATTDLESYRLADMGDDLRAMQRQFVALQTLRQRVDRDLMLPAVQRTPGLSNLWFDSSTALTTQVFNLWMEFTGHFTTIDPIVTQRFMFQHFLGSIMRYAGRERALIGGLIVADAPPTPKDQEELLQWHGSVEQSWQFCARIAERSGMAPDITPYLKDARSHYQTVNDMVHDLFYVPGAHPATPYPIGIDLWLEVATQTTDSLYTLKDAALKQTRDYVEALERHAKRAILLQILLLFIALLICLFSFRIVMQRVISPTQQMVDALVAVMEGKSSHLTEMPNRSDEIGKLAQVLRAFQENMKDLALLAAVVKSSDDAIISKTLDGTITSWNAAAEHLFGYAATEAIGQSVNLIVPPERREEERHVLEQLLEGKQSLHLETQRMHKNGKHIAIALTISQITNKAGQIIGVSKIARDITERKAAEEKLLRYTSDLERSNKELDDFAYIASHDLKEPLRGIHNHSRFLLEDNAEKLDKDSVDRLNRLLYLTQRMEKLVNDLLYFSRLGRQELAIQSADLNGVVHDIESLIDVFLKEHHAHIVVPKPLPTITCDKTRITEALRNLVTNAIKYNDKPEKTVEIGLLPSHAGPDGATRYRVFYVRDNGIGIPLEFHEEIFRIFKRLQSSGNKQEEGTGVGLTFVKKIIERHGGKIWLESQLGMGTTFYFTLGGEINDETAA